MYTRQRLSEYTPQELISLVLELQLQNQRPSLDALYAKTFRRLIRAEEQMHQLVRFAPMPIVLIHIPKNRILHINEQAEQLLQYTHDELPTLQDWFEKVGLQNLPFNTYVQPRLRQLYDESRSLPLAIEKHTRLQNRHGQRFRIQIAYLTVDKLTYCFLLKVGHKSSFEPNMLAHNEAYQRMQDSNEALRQYTQELVLLNENLAITKRQAEQTLSREQRALQKIEQQNKNLYTRKKQLQEAYQALRTTEEELRQYAEELSATNESLERTKQQLELTLQREQEINDRIERKNKLLYTQRKELKKTLRALRAAQEQIIAQEKMASLGVLVAGIAHEINNPISYIYASSEALSTLIQDVSQLLLQYERLPEALLPPELQRFKDSIGMEELLQELPELVDNIQTGTRQTTEIVRSLRSFARMDEAQLSHYDIKQIIDDSLLILHNQYKHTVTLIKEYQATKPLYCHPGKLQQVFVNIISNAIFAVKQKKYPASDSPKILIRIEDITETATLQITIADNGEGIDEAVQRRIFEPFYTTKPVGIGSGLGLYISEGIVRNHQGRIRLQSARGEGTTFIVMLPYSKGSR